MPHLSIPAPALHVAEKRNQHWQVVELAAWSADWRFIKGSNGRSQYLLRMESGAMVARTFRIVQVEQHYGEPTIRIGKRFTLTCDDLPAAGDVLVVGNRVGTLTWFGGKSEYTGSNIDGGVIHKVYVSSPHRRNGVASAMLATARDLFPGRDIRHSSALSPDGAAWASVTRTPNDLAPTTTSQIRPA